MREEDYFIQTLSFNFTLFDTQKIVEYLTDMFEKGFTLVNNPQNFQFKFQKSDTKNQKYCILVDEEKIDDKTLAEIQENHWVAVKRFVRSTFFNKYTFVILKNNDVQADESSISKHNTNVARSYQPQKSFFLNLLIMLIILFLFIFITISLFPFSFIVKQGLISLQVGRALYYYLINRDFFKAQEIFIKKTLNNKVQQEIGKSNWDTYFIAFEKKERIFKLIDLITCMITFIVMQLLT